MITNSFDLGTIGTFPIINTFFTHKCKKPGPIKTSSKKKKTV